MIIFDCDGVLIDSEAIFCSVDADALTALGFPTHPAEIARRFAGIPHNEAWAVMAKEVGFEQPTDWLENIKIECDRRIDQELSAVPGAAIALEALSKRGFVVCVASSTFLPNLQKNLARAGLLPLIGERVFSVSQVKRPKPAPDVFLYAASQMGSDPAECIVVEDSVVGVTAARRAGMRVWGFVGAGHGYEGLDEKLMSAGAERTFATMTALTAALVASSRTDD